MKQDAIYAFVVAALSEIGSLFVNDPKVSLVVQILGGMVGVLGHALHLDGGQA